MSTGGTLASIMPPLVAWVSEIQRYNVTGSDWTKFRTGATGVFSGDLFIMDTLTNTGKPVYKDQIA